MVAVVVEVWGSAGGHAHPNNNSVCLPLPRAPVLLCTHACVRVCLQVIADGAAGLLFKNKRDRKVVNVDPRAAPGDNSSRTDVHDDAYLQVVLFDHVTRRRS